MKTETTTEFFTSEFWDPKLFRAKNCVTHTMCTLFIFFCDASMDIKNEEK